MGALRHFTEDPTFRSQLYRSIGVRTLLETLASNVADTARAMAPDDPATTSDDLRSSITHEVTADARGFAARVGAENFKGHWFEFGTARMPARPFLRPALEQEVGPLDAAGGEDA